MLDVTPKINGSAQMFIWYQARAEDAFSLTMADADATSFGGEDQAVYPLVPMAQHHHHRDTRKAILNQLGDHWG